MLRLAQIELLGFKSFPHKTVVDLDRGVTCVVGPNGSGKSNLADAINFAFGNQSGKELRASRLSSLIFAGTEQIRPLNLASVTLHFEYTGQRPALELAGDAEHAAFGDLSLLDEDAESETGETPHPGETEDGEPSEPLVSDKTPTVVKLLQELQPGARLSLTRRVFRDGTAGYYINGESVRLRDVDELFNRFNLGRTAVFSINQGEVEKKILGTPQEMREWLAEATGVALLLQHKNRAQARLKRTQLNLERLDDIRSNTRQLVADLAEQRQAAEEHLRLKQQLRVVELNEIRREVEFAQRQQEAGAQALSEAQAAVDEAQGRLEKARLAAAGLQESREQLEQLLRDSESELAAGQERQAQLQQQMALARQSAATHEAAAAQVRQDLEELGGQIVALDLEIEMSESARLAAREMLEGAERKARELSQERERAQSVLGSILSRQQQQRDELLEAAANAARSSNQLEGAERHLRALATQLESRQQQAHAAGSRLEVLEAEIAEERQRSESFALSLGEQRDLLDGHALALVRLKEELAAADEVVSGLRRQLAELTARRQTIAELAEASDKADGRQLLLNDTELSVGLQRVTDLTFPPELRPAFTRLLAHVGEALAGPPGQRRKALAQLAPRGSEALWLDCASQPALHEDSVWRKVNAEPGLIGGLVNLLGDVLLADNEAEAEVLLLGNHGIEAVVLRDGSALLGRGHAWLGMPSTERALQVAKHSDLAYLDTQREALRSELGGAEDLLRKLRDSQLLLQRQRDDAASAVAAAEAQLQSQLALCERLQKAQEERHSDLLFHRSQAQELHSEQERLAAELPGLMAARDQSLERQAAIEVNGRELEKALAEADARLAEARQAEAGAAAERGLAEQQAKYLETQLLDMAERRHNARQRREGLLARVAAHDQGQTASNEAAASAHEESALLASRLASLIFEVEQQREQRHELAAAAEQIQLSLETAAQAASRAEQDAYRAENQRDAAIERVASWLEQLREKHSMTLSELLNDPAIQGEQRIEFGAPRGIGSQALVDQDSATELVAVQLNGEGDAQVSAEADKALEAEAQTRTLDVNEVGRLRLRDAKWRINLALEELGPVNLLAIEQHSEQSRKLEFMDAQASELERAAQALGQLICDLDQGTEQRYSSALGLIEQRFGELFTTLFGGGSAKLRFENTDNLVESGVEIEVQLPGSRKMALRSLSGGQRSLIFLALFFAVHSVRSPGFCILDEADAALDDANVRRYTQLIQRFSGEEQFIVVTHNKITMEVADRLVGVVGRPKGVSNLLAVDLKKAQKLAEHKSGAA